MIPRNFQFSILQRLAPDMDADDVISLETTRKTLLSLCSKGAMPEYQHLLRVDAFVAQKVVHVHEVAPVALKPLDE